MEDIILRKAGRPKGGKLTDEERLETKRHTKEYQKKYREMHRTKFVKLKYLIQNISQIKINDKDT